MDNAVVSFCSTDIFCQSLRPAADHRPGQQLQSRSQELALWTRGGVQQGPAHESAAGPLVFVG